MDEIGGSGFKMQDAGCQMQDARISYLAAVALLFAEAFGNALNEREAG